MANYSINSNRKKTLLIVRGSEVERIRSGISNIAVMGWEDEIEISGLSDKKMPRIEANSHASENSYKLLIRCAETPIARIIVQEGVPLDLPYLEGEGLTIRVVKSSLTLIQVVDDELKERNLHWLKRAMSEWAKSSIPCASPEIMVQQFAELGYSQVGKQLLKGLRVITEAELREAFKTSDADNVGLHVVHAFVHDEEPGSSSLAVRNVLEHLHPSGVKKIDVANFSELAALGADVVYIYEDGLWSGVELVKRLAAICRTTHFKDSNVQLHFRYGVTSDAGLVAARLFAKRERIGRVQFRAAAPENHFTFLKPGVDTCLRKLADRSDESIRQALDAEIEPYAFRADAGWADSRSSAINVCSKIGEQLVKPFLERKAKEKFDAKKGSDAGLVLKEISDEKVAKWGLGALGFASTVVFASSIPKPALPLLWLDGQVSIDGRTVKWRPLFWDARRTGSADKV